MPGGRVLLRPGRAGGDRRSRARQGEHHRHLHAQPAVVLTSRETPKVDLDAIARSTTIDLTTVGRRSGDSRRIEIWWFRVDGRFVITGTPGPRDWYANVVANPWVVIHVDGLDLRATAVPIEDREFRRRVFTHPDASWYSTQAALDDLVALSPMVEVVFDG